MFDRIPESGVADLDRAQDRLFAEVERPVRKCPVRDLIVGCGMEPIAFDDFVLQGRLFAHFDYGRHCHRLRDRKIIELGKDSPHLTPAVTFPSRNRPAAFQILQTSSYDRPP